MVTAMSLMKRDLAKVAHSATVLEAAKMMRDRKIGSVFIEQNDRIVGIGHMPGFIPVSTIMSSPVIGIDGKRPITEAADLMERSQTRHLAVMQSGDIVGVLSVRDLFHPVSIDEF